MVDDVLVGRIIKPHGLHGEVGVDVLSDVEGRFAPGVTFVVGGRTLTVAAAREHGGRLLLSFAEVADRSAAEALRGTELYGPRGDTLDSETYFAHELVGLAVLAADAAPLGTVVDLVLLPPAAAYDLVEVERDDGSTWLLPLVDDYVEVVDWHGEQALMVVDPPEGLVPPPAGPA